jgi:hypothetical protein
MASPALVGDRLHVVDEKGVTRMFAIEATGLREVGTAALGEKVYASPAFLDKRLYMRAEKHLYAIGGAAP